MKKYPLPNIAKPHNWLIHRQIVDELAPAITRFASGKLLDIGCGNKPYLYLTEDLVSQHIGLEHEETKNEANADIWGTAYKIPSGDESFDTILCTDVLEHLEEPGMAVNEAARVLKSGGYAIYTMPFSWHIHEAPRDFYRYSCFGIEYLFSKHGFEIIILKGITGFWGNLAQLICYYLNEHSLLRRRPMLWVKRILMFFIQRLAYRIERSRKMEKFTSEYIVVAKKI